MAETKTAPKIEISVQIPAGRKMKVLKVAQLSGKISKVSIGSSCTGVTKLPVFKGKCLEFHNDFQTSNIESIHDTQDGRYLIRTATSIYLAEYV